MQVAPCRDQACASLVPAPATRDLMSSSIMYRQGTRMRMMLVANRIPNPSEMAMGDEVLGLQCCLQQDPGEAAEGGQGGENDGAETPQAGGMHKG